MVQEICISLSLVTSISGATVSTASKGYNAIVTRSLMGSPFRKLGGFDRAKVLDCDDGYVYYYTETYKAPFTPNSDLYLEHFVSEFTPGHMARLNGNNAYKDYNLSNGFVHVTLEQYSENGKRGGKIAPKEFWPKSTSFTTTIGSSFGGSINLGLSSEAGVQIGNGTSIFGKQEGNAGLTLSFDKSASTVMTDPVLSSQFSSSNHYEVQWSISSQNKPVAGSVTYTLDSYYLFEMSNDVINANRDAYIATYDVMFQGTHKVIWQWFDGWTFNSSVRISCFL